MPPKNTPDSADETVSAEVVAPVWPEHVAIPDQFNGTVDFTGWANALINRSPYVEPDPEYIARKILLATILSKSVDEILSESGILKLQEWVPNIPGATTGPLLITDLYVTSSDFGEGAPCYVIYEATHMLDGEPRKFTTGATQVQAQTLAMLKVGAWPIECQIMRMKAKDRGGRFLLRMMPPE